MKVTTFDIKGLKLIEPDVFRDERGFFMESYNKTRFTKIGISDVFVQDNHSRSSKNVLRGLHFQVPPFAQSKLVRVTSGEVVDVAVDLRADSATYGQWQAVKLNDRNNNIFYVPEGFAHGFVVLSDTADFLYKVNNIYSKEHDGGIIWNDKDINIDWEIDNPMVSDKDSKLLTLKEFNSPF